MKKLEEVAARIGAAVTEAPAQRGPTVTTQIRDGVKWIMITGPTIAPGEPRLVVSIPDNGRDPQSMQPED